MSAEEKTCQHCARPFAIEPEDFDFYSELRVPAPTWCPECRIIRRLSWRNTRILYKRPCDVPGHSELLISNFSPESMMPVYDQMSWWSDAWDPLSYGQNYDFNTPFFEQWRDLFYRVPQPNLTNMNPIASDYVNFTLNSKECYLLFSGTENEKCLFGTQLFRCKESCDIEYSRECILCYECVNCERCYRVTFSQDAYDCMDSAFLIDCKNCRSCFGCVGLRNKAYCLFNKQLKKEEYEQQIKKFSGSFTAMLEARQTFERLSGIRKYAHVISSQNVSGDYIKNSKNCQNCFDVVLSENSKYLFSSYGGGTFASYDISVGLRAEFSYEILAGGEGNRNRFSAALHECTDVQYVYLCFASSHLFGCVGLRNKHYCILNKQYTKEAYEALVPKIIEHMNRAPYRDSRGTTYTYGEFFPSELSPFAYNETIAQEHFPLTRENAGTQGFRWKDSEQKLRAITMKNNAIPDRIDAVSDTILRHVIECADHGQCLHQCTGAFQLIPQELAFYRQMNIPLPRFCPHCRHGARIAAKNPQKLWKRSCQCAGTNSENALYHNGAPHTHGTNACLKTFETSYTPDRPETLYCESCYQTEIV